jgi:hypothetical protein
MRKGLLLFLFLAVLAAPVMAAAPRDDDPRGRGVIDRVVTLIKRVVRAFDDIVPMPPNP